MATPNEYVAAGNYVAMEPDQLTVHEGELLRLLEAGSDNWWLMESTLSEMQGWVPARYIAAVRHLSSSSMQSIESSSSSIQSKVPADRFDGIAYGCRKTNYLEFPIATRLRYD